MIKAIIFDVGGTLLGAPDLFEAISNLSKPSKFSRNEIFSNSIKIFDKIISECRNGNGFKKVTEIIEMILQHLFECNKSEIKEISTKLYWKTFVTDSFLLDDAKLTLDTLFNEGIELIVSSDADAELIYAQFKKHKILRYISDFYISSDVRAYKPNDIIADILKERIKNHNLNEVLFVGDSSVDIETGKKMGVKTVRIGSDKKNLFSEDHSILNLKELCSIIKNHH